MSATSEQAKIKVPAKILAACNVFAQNSVSSHQNHYAERQQRNVDSIRRQIWVGKIGEWGVWFWLGLDVPEPDMNIYGAGEKSFSADLQVGKQHLHVKSQSLQQQEEFGASWVFQASGKGGGHTDPLLRRTQINHWVVLCGVDEIEGWVWVHRCIPTHHLEGLLREPRIERLQGIKRCLYLEDLADYPALPNMFQSTSE